MKQGPGVGIPAETPQLTYAPLEPTILCIGHGYYIYYIYWILYYILYMD